MFNNRLVKLFVGLAIVVMAVLSIGAVISTRHNVVSNGKELAH